MPHGCTADRRLTTKYAFHKQGEFCLNNGAFENRAHVVENTIPLTDRSCLWVVIPTAVTIVTRIQDKIRIRRCGGFLSQVILTGYLERFL